MNKEYLPAKRVPLKDGRFLLVFVDFHRLSAVLNGREDGYALGGFVKRELQKTAPILLEQLRFDSEAGMFSVSADTEEPLLKVAEILRINMENPPT